ncbi:hypothetical protein, partial [Streptomyces sp. NPDC048340]|uniref:hypothetical protein n=1 Tax=Streptomyces sp. NPDC048340 TaxID=3365537 RepID=UPI0037235300
MAEVLQAGGRGTSGRAGGRPVEAVEELVEDLFSTVSLSHETAIGRGDGVSEACASEPVNVIKAGRSFYRCVGIVWPSGVCWSGLLI